jgi:hypothetical protein
MLQTSKVNAETRMLVDGELVQATSGKTFANVGDEACQRVATGCRLTATPE